MYNRLFCFLFFFSSSSWSLYSIISLDSESHSIYWRSWQNCYFNQLMIVLILVKFILTFSQLMINFKKFVLITLNFDFLMFTYNLYYKKRLSTTYTYCTCFFKILKKNENIINICENKYVEIFSKCDVNIRLKCR